MNTHAAKKIKDQISEGFMT